MVPMFGNKSSSRGKQDADSGPAPREPITVVGDTVASGSSVDYEFEMPESALLTGIRLHCYEGQEFDLRYSITVEESANDRTVNLVNDLAGVGYLAGNGDEYELDIRREVSAGDVVRVRVENTDVNGYTYHTNLIVGVDYDNTLAERVARTLGRVV